jgi:CDP-paratose 2-epimerase
MSLSRPEMKSAEQPILITGGCGFLGSNLAAELARRGRRVVIADNFSRAGAWENAEWLKKQEGGRIAVEVADVRDPAAICALASSAAAVMHLAAQVAVTTSLQKPAEDFEINLRGTVNVLEAVRRYNPHAPIIFASTNKVYGSLIEDQAAYRAGSRYIPRNKLLSEGVSEEAPLDFHSPYGCSKGAADQYVRDYGRVFGLRTVVLRMSCIYGPRQFGTEDQGWIAHFMLSAMHGVPITIYGDGYQVRDALYVEDAVNAWIAALDGIDLSGGRIFNLGGGAANAVSLWETLGVIGELLGHKPQVRCAPWRPGDQLWYVSGIGSISRTLGWAPRVSLRDGLCALKSWLSGRSASPPQPVLQLEEVQ